MKTLTIKKILLMALMLLPSLFQSCDIQSLLDEMNNEDEEENYSYNNDIGGKTTEYGTKSWAALSDKAPFISKFEAVGSDLNYSSYSTGVRDGERVEEVHFERATTDDEAAPTLKKCLPTATYSPSEMVL